MKNKKRNAERKLRSKEAWFDAGTAAFGKLAAAKSFDSAVAVQSEFAREAFQGYVGQVSRVGEIFADMAKSAAKPYEALFGKNGK